MTYQLKFGDVLVQLLIPPALKLFKRVVYLQSIEADFLRLLSDELHGIEEAVLHPA